MDVMEIRRALLSMIGGGKIMKIEAGTYTPSTDEISQNISISHSLGVNPDFILVKCDEFTPDTSSQNVYIVNSLRTNKSVSFSNATGGYIGFYVRTRTQSDGWQIHYENLNTAKFANESTFKIPYYQSTDKLKANVAYHWVVGKYE